MAQSLLSILEQLQGNIETLKEEIGRLRQKNRELEEENAGLREKTAEAEASREKALLDAEYMAVSHKLADSPDTLADTRRLIAGLIRNIDRCIAMLKE